MDLDDLLRRYFSSTDVAAVSPDVLTSGLERCQVDLGLEKDRGKRFALWALLHMLGSAPDLEAAFKDADEREAARNFMDLLAASEGEGRGGEERGVKCAFAKSPETSPAFFANSPEPDQLRPATPLSSGRVGSFAACPHHPSKRRFPWARARPAVQSSHALLLLDVRKPEMVSGLAHRRT